MQTHGIKGQWELQYFLLDYNRKKKYLSCYHALDFYPIQINAWEMSIYLFRVLEDCYLLDPSSPSSD